MTPRLTSLGWGLVALAAAASLALLLGAGFAAGHQWASNAKNAQALRDAGRLAAAQARVLEQARQRGQADVQALQAQLAQQHTYATTLQERLARAPLAIARQCPAPGASPGLAARTPALEPGQAFSAAGQAPPQAPAHPAGGSGVLLTVAAVSLWNSALAGVDMPAGACSPADTASEACAADSGATLEAAWANHATNAASCAADRARYQALIDHLANAPTQRTALP